MPVATGWQCCRAGLCGEVPWELKDVFFLLFFKNPHSSCLGLAFLVLGDVVSRQWDLKGVAKGADSGRLWERLTSGWQASLPSELRFLQMQRWEIQLVGREGGGQKLDQGREEAGPCAETQSPQEDKGPSESGWSGTHN